MVQRAGLSRRETRYDCHFAAIGPRARRCLALTHSCALNLRLERASPADLSRCAEARRRSCLCGAGGRDESRKRLCVAGSRRQVRPALGRYHPITRPEVVRSPCRARRCRRLAPHWFAGSSTGDPGRDEIADTGDTSHASDHDSCDRPDTSDSGHGVTSVTAWTPAMPRTSEAFATPAPCRRLGKIGRAHV